MKIGEYVRLAVRYRDDPLFRHYLHGRKVLDIGCGAGEFLARDPANFVGIDVDETLIASCRGRGFNAQAMSALALSFPDESFDAVHAAQLIEHFSPSDATTLLSEAARVLRPGGVIFLTTPGVRNVWGTFSHIRPYPPAAFRKLLSAKVEGYIGGTRLPLRMEASFATRFTFDSRLLTFISRTIDLAFPSSDPIGWTVILCKAGENP